MTDCIFCKIVAGEIPADKLYETENWLAFLDIKPIHLGHTLLIPKNHHRNLLDLSPNLLAELGSELQKIATVIKKATNADAINIGINNEPAAGQVVFHTHAHIIPRFENDGLNSWHREREFSPEEFATIKTKILASF